VADKPGRGVADNSGRQADVPGLASIWWQSELGSAVHEDVFAHLDHLDERLRPMRQRDLVHEAVYNNLHHGAGALDFMSGLVGGNIRLNVTKSMVDTLTSKIGKNKAAIKAVTNGADFSFRRKGKKLSKFVNAKLEELRSDRLNPLVARDCMIVGTGIVQAGDEFNDICLERVPKGEVYVDPVEGRYGTPRQIHRKRKLAREVLLALFPKFRAQILDAEASRPQDWEWSVDWDYQNMVDVAVSYHLPSGPDADDGRYAVTLRNVTLHHGTWRHSEFPLSFIHWNSPTSGFWGTGLVADLLPIQAEIDKLAQDIQTSFHLGASLKVFLPRGSKISKTQLNNRIGTIVEFSGQLPVFHAPNTVSTQVIDWVRYLFEIAYRIAGVSEMSSQGTFPTQRFGDSQPAIAAAYDLETERFAQFALSYRNLQVDEGNLVIMVATDLYSDDRDVKTKWKDRNFIHTIPWSEVDMERDQFVLGLEATNFLPETTAGKLATLKELTQIGLTPQQLLGPNIESPDLEKVFAQVNAAYNNADWVIDQLQDEDVEPPEPETFHELGLTIQLVKAAYNNIQTEGAPEEILERLRDWLKAAYAVLKMAEGPALAPQAPPAEAVEGGVTAPAAAPPPMNGAAPNGVAAPPLPDPSALPPPA